MVSIVVAYTRFESRSLLRFSVGVDAPSWKYIYRNEYLPWSKVYKFEPVRLSLLRYNSTDLYHHHLSSSDWLLLILRHHIVILRSVRPQSELIPTPSTMYLQARLTFIFSTLAIFSSFVDAKAVAFSERCKILFPSLLIKSLFSTSIAKGYHSFMCQGVW